MRRLAIACFVLFCGLAALASAVTAAPSAPVDEPDTCPPAIGAAERLFHLPAALLGAIAFVESGRADPITGRSRPWPWTTNVGGVGHFYATKIDAVAAVQGLLLQGIHSIDVGCMQINLMYHPNAFASLNEAFDPPANTMYGARFLSALYHQTGNWPQATADYHSLTPDLGRDYESKVMALWPLAGKYPEALRVPSRPIVGSTEDYSVYTPAFAAALKDMRRDYDRLAEQQLMVTPARAVHPVRTNLADENSGYTPEFAAEMRQMQASYVRLGAGPTSATSFRPHRVEH